jgi:phenylalanyl-tRNA synthetase beta chain
MRFSLSWLADYVRLGDGLAYEPDANGRHALGGLTEAERQNALRLGEKLTALGLAVEDYPIATFGTEQEATLDVDVTSNRPDAMCHFGLARELAVALAVPLRRPEIPLFAARGSDGASGAVVLEDGEGCPRYVARIVRGVKVGVSPAWLRRRLEAIGLRSINNVVDATNFVLWELGQPLHAFDLATIPGGEIRVRRAKAGERLTTLDGKERVLDAEILVIADRARAIALAGIMGGRDTEVTAATTDVLLESALFERRRVRSGSKQLALHTDASHRFERGVDFDGCDEASRRCAALIVEVAGGTVEEPALDAVARGPAQVGWSLDAARLERFAGCAVADGEIERILGGLGFDPAPAGDRLWRGAVPGWRAHDFEPRRTGRDAGIEAYPQDLYEEVLRHVGFDSIPATLPSVGGIDAGTNPEHERAAAARDRLCACGFAEAIHYAFQPLDWDERYPALERQGAPLALANPLSERYAVLRRSLVPNLVAAAETNAHRGAAGVRLFEVGHLFPGARRADLEPAEIEAIAWVGGGEPGTKWDAQPAFDLFALKGVADALFEELGAAAPRAEPSPLPGVVEGTGALWRDGAGALVGWFGRIDSAELPFPLFAAEVALDRLPLAQGHRPVVAPPRLPGISADLTLTHPLSLSWAELAAAIDATAVDLLVGYRLKERYQGAGLPAGAVATTITFDYHGGERSLTQEEVNARHAALADGLERRFGVARKETS